MNKNRKTTMAILIGLTTFTIVGCGKEPVTEDLINEANLVLEDALVDENIAIDDENIAIDDEALVDKDDYTAEQIKADFKIIEDMSAEVVAAAVNDSFVAALVPSTGVKVSDSDLFMDKEIENGKKNTENIKIPQVKKVADIYIESFQKQSDLTKKLSKEEIDEAGFTSGISKLSEDLASTLTEDMTLYFELAEILEKEGLSKTDLLDSYAIQTKATTIAKEKYTKNMQDFMKKAMK